MDGCDSQPADNQGAWYMLSHGTGDIATPLVMGYGKAASKRGDHYSSTSSAVRSTVLVIAVSVMAVLLMSVLFGARWTPSTDDGDTSWVSAGVRVVVSAVSDQRAAPSATVPDPRDRLLGGLLSPDFDDRSCLSRYRAALYRRPSLHILSTHLVSSLRRYEALHRLCGPGTSPYACAVARLRESMQQHSNTSGAAAPSECRYLIWSPLEGLGNRILSIASAFLYALLTDRVLLVHHHGDDLDDLFCEPFPGDSTSWVLPEKDFPIQSIERFGVRTRESLGNALRRGEGASGERPPAPWLYVHLRHEYTVEDRLFFCDDGQDTVREVGWLVLRSDNYFVPGLFMIQRYERELARLFPRRDAVFHHLGRYLFHPSNTVWGMVTRYHGSYLAEAEERVGVQVRTFSWAPISHDERYSQIVSCAHRENILPEVIAVAAAAADNVTTGAPPSSDHQEEEVVATRRKTVLVVSLHGEYYEKMSSMYYEQAAAGGEAVSVFQPTHLGGQHSGERQHNQKALAEMVLLSFSDVVITSAVSTFGYVSQGLAGLRPWVLMIPIAGKAPDPPCRLAATIEPCFHTPPNYGCQARAYGDSGRMVQHVRHCEDFPQGVQLVEY